MVAKAVVILALCGLTAAGVSPRGERQIDPSQFANKVQETFKPPSMGSNPFGGLPQLPQGGSGSGSFLPGRGKRQVDPTQQFSEFANQFQEAFKPPSMGSNPFGGFPQLPQGGSGSGSFLPGQGKRQVDPTQQFSEFANQFQEAFKPPSMGSNPFGGFPQVQGGSQQGQGSFLPGMGKRGAD